VLLGRAADRTLYVLDVRRLRGSPRQVEALVKHTAGEDPRGTQIVMEQEPGSSGKTVIDHYLRLLQGYPFRGERSTGSKADRAQPLAAQAEGGAVRLLRGPGTRTCWTNWSCSRSARRTTRWTHFLSHSTS
jgi:phage terminase large subunit-like protein